MPAHASLLFGRNLAAFVLAFTKDGNLRLDLADDIQKGSLITHEGTVVNARAQEALQRAAPERRG
jgi:NAD/NADP transhydrogenase alpha subunit